jgi:leucyl-tRNA synthetase
MELMNELKPDALTPPVLKLGLTTLVRLLAPMVPHIAAELWADLTGSADLIGAGWPTYDPSQMIADEVEYPVQANGKIRGKVTLPRTLAGADLEAAVRAHPDVLAIIGSQTVKKLVVVPGRIINLVLG